MEWDHRPPIILRAVSKDGTDYDPRQTDSDFIDGLHEECHQKRTTGRSIGANKTATTLGSDIWLKTKFARLERPPRKKQKIPSRPNPWGKRKFK